MLLEARRNEELEAIPLERLEHEITELAAHIYAATCRWLGLVAEFDRRKGWEEWGCKSCSQWLSVRCGLGSAAAREQVRVGRRLSDLPAIRARFARGELSYSQVRALTRVATAEIEEELLMVARHATGAQLEVLVRAYRGVLASQPGAAARAHRDRYVVHSHEDDGTLVIQARLPAEEGALVLAALEAGRDALRAERRDAADDPGASASAETPAGADPPGDVDASAETPSEPTSVSSADALVLMAEKLLATGPPSSGRGERYQVVVHVEASALADDAGAGCHLEAGPALHPETARRLCCDSSLVRIVERDGRPLSVGRKTRSVPPALKRALRTRDRGCRFPGCTERRFVDGHHIEHWARGGKTELANLVQLCRRHHRLVHEGGYAVQRRRGGAMVFRRPDGQSIPDAPSLRRGEPRVLVAGNRGDAPRIDSDTCVPRWYGGRLEPVLAVDGLVQVDARIAAEPPPVPMPA